MSISLILSLEFDIIGTILGADEPEQIIFRNNLIELNIDINNCGQM